MSYSEHDLDAERQSIADLTTTIKSTKGDTPPPLVGASTTAVGDYVYVFGGRVASTNIMENHLYILHIPTLMWLKHDLPSESEPSPRYFHTATAYKNRYLIIFGGMSHDLSQTTDHPPLCAMDDIYMLDLELFVWIPLAVSSSLYSPQARYAHIATLWNNDKLVVMGGQNTLNHHVNEMNIFDLVSHQWTYGSTLEGPFDAYRAVLFSPSQRDDTLYGKAPTPFWNDSQSPPACIYANYNFCNLCRDLQTFWPPTEPTQDLPNLDSYEMENLPPGLRFPSGYIKGDYFIFSGTHLSSSEVSFQIWALNLITSTWSRMDTGPLLTAGSWNRGILHHKNYYIFGNKERDMKEDYSYRIVSFENIATVELEALGVYSSLPSTCSIEVQKLGLQLLDNRALSDLTIWTSDNKFIHVNSDILAKKWPTFAQLFDYQISQSKGPYDTLRKQMLMQETYAVTLAFLQYLYTDHLNTVQQHEPHILARLLVLSDIYHLKRLKGLVTFELHQLLTLSTASLVYETATLSLESGLQIRALRLMINAKRVLNRASSPPPLFRHSVREECISPGGSSVSDASSQSMASSPPSMRSFLSGHSYKQKLFVEGNHSFPTLNHPFILH
ncbi:hypothetical protein BDB01DRAFT_803919 [Pilobolus umbonatus]|nr:hypothetical protein BDB01DRAFT_803919 [Pilobolus umbonatus]